MAKLLNFFPSAFVRDRLVLVSLAAALVVNIILWLAVFGKFGYSRELIPLHFNIVYGIDFVGSARELYELPLSGLLLLGVNFYLGKTLYPREKLFAYFLSFAALLVQILLGIAVLTLLVLNS